VARDSGVTHCLGFGGGGAGEIFGDFSSTAEGKVSAESRLTSAWVGRYEHTMVTRGRKRTQVMHVRDVRESKP
jgi:hypothetical protein